MSDTVQTSSQEEDNIECYLCNKDVSVDNSMDVPLTTGGKVKVHPSCMEFYMSQQQSVAAGGGCGGCTGEQGCC